MGIGPSTKETTRHHFKDPLLELLGEDNDCRPVGVIVAGIAADYESKKYIIDRLGTWGGALKPDGAIVSMDSWGNSHIDFNLILEKLSNMNIPAVGLCFQGKQAEPVTPNSSHAVVIDINKSPGGRETEVLGESNINRQDARKALAMLKLLSK